jgi:diguanylate cyclase (GGDEF)-like protein
MRSPAMSARAETMLLSCPTEVTANDGAEAGVMAGALVGVQPSAAERDWLAGLDADAQRVLAGLLGRVRAAGAAEAESAHLAGEAELRRLAYTDLLTGLGNRAGLQAAAAGVFAGSAGSRVGALLADLDGLKPVNDTHGHDVGDLLLAAAGRRLNSFATVAGGVAARLGGDEFAVLLPGLPADPRRAGLAALAAAERLAGRLARPYPAGAGLTVQVGASVGAATVPAYQSLPTLLAAADLAMYEAKHAGGGTRLAPDPGHQPTADQGPPPRPGTRLRDYRHGAGSPHGHGWVRAVRERFGPPDMLPRSRNAPPA